MKKFTIKSGCRNSKLSLIQTQNGLKNISQDLPGIDFEVIGVQSLGDKDKTLVLDDPKTPEDIWTKELDQMLRDKQIDIAVHSAKDLPEKLASDINFFWLPWSEKPGDVLIYALGKKESDLPKNPIVATSSERRSAYIFEHHPSAILKPIRGTIEERLQQLDEGKFDILIMAEAALIRLDLTHRISYLIPLKTLPPPEGQGKIAITYFKGNPYGELLKSIYTHPVTFVGSGPGEIDLITVKGLKKIQSSNCILYDALANPELLDEAPADCQKIFVGKRAKQHHMEQKEITELILKKVKEGKKVIRLKGGDPSIFGRLKEEISELQKEGVPYQVIPGISSLNGATISGDLLLTARGVNQAFLTATATTEAISQQYLESYAKIKVPVVYFMGTKQLKAIVKAYNQEGWPKETPIAIIHHSYATISIRSTLEHIEADLKKENIPSPALICIGDFASEKNKISSPERPLQNQNILLPGVKESVRNLSAIITDFGGNAIAWPLVSLQPTELTQQQLEKIKEAELIILTSPASVRIFFAKLNEYKINIMPKTQFAVTGPGTNDVLFQHGHIATIIPEDDFSSVGLIEAIAAHEVKNSKIVFPHSQIGGTAIIEALKSQKHFFSFSLYENKINTKSKDLPNFDAVLFTSPSGISNFVTLYGKGVLKNKTIGVIGKVTNKEAQNQSINVSFISQNSTTEGLVKALIAHLFQTKNRS